MSGKKRLFSIFMVCIMTIQFILPVSYEAYADTINSEIVAYTGYQDVGDNKSILIGNFKTFGQAKETCVQYKNTYIVDQSGKEIWRAKYEVYQDSYFLGRYSTLEEAKQIAILYSKSKILDVTKNDLVIWQNVAYRAYQDVNEELQILIGNYDNIEQAKNTAYYYKNSYILDITGNEVWRGRYEIFQGDNFEGRYYTIEEAKSYAIQLEASVIKDVMNNDEIIWKNNVYKLYQDTGNNKNIFISRYHNLNDAISKGLGFKNTFILDQNNNEVWRAKYEVYNQNDFLGRFDNLNDAKNTAKTRFNSRVIDVTQGDKIVWENIPFRLYQDIEGNNDIYIGGYSNLKDAQATGYYYKNSYVLNENNSEVWRARYEVYNGTLFIGRYEDLNQAIQVAASIKGSKVLDSKQADKVVWVNIAYRVFQDIEGDKDIFIGNYDKYEEAVSVAQYYRQAYVINQEGKELWRASYELFINGIFNGRFSSLDEAISIGSRYENATINDCVSGEEVWRSDYIYGYVKVNGVLNVRSGPGVEYNKVGELINGDQVVILDTKIDSWYKIKYGEGIGYVSKDYVVIKVPEASYDIVIDPGHGGREPGAIGPNGLNEKDVVLNVSLMLRDILQSRGYRVLMTREKDEYVSLDRRVEISNNSDAKFFVSIHANSYTNPSANGTETLVKENTGESAILAAAVQNKLIQKLGLTNRGIKERPDLRVLKNNNKPAILAELAFISNYNEQALLGNKDFQYKAAVALSEAIMDTYPK